MKIKWLLTIIAGASLASVTSSQAISVMQGFGTIPGTTQAQNPYSGSGIPINTSEYVTVSGLSGGDTLTFAMAATQHGSGNPAPGNNGSGVYTVGTGLVGGRSKWNFDFYGNSQLGLLSSYVFTLTETANGHTSTFDPSAIADNVGGPNSFGNSESLDFGTYGGPLSYDPNQDDTYQFVLTVTSVTGAFIASDGITVIAGRGASTPDTTSTAVLLGAAFISMTYMMKRRGVRSVA